MANNFKFDAFILCNSSDQEVAEELSIKLDAAGLMVYLPEVDLTVQANQEATAALKDSRCLVFVFSNTITSIEWRILESYTVAFRDPKETIRRFIPVRTESGETIEPLRPYFSINWKNRSESELEALVSVCSAIPATNKKGIPIISTSGNKRFKGHGGGVYSVGITKTGDYAVSGGVDCTVRLWNLSDETCEDILDGHRDHVRSVAVTLDGKYAASGSLDKEVRLWSLETRKCISIFEEHTAAVNSVAISDDASILASASDDRRVFTIDGKTGLSINSFTGHSDSVLSVALSPDGRTLLSGDIEGIIYLWDVITGKAKKLLKGHSGPVNAIAISRDSRIAVSGSYDRTIKVWDLETLKCISSLEGHTGSVQTLCLTKNDTCVVSGGTDQTIRVWQLSTGQCIGASTPQLGIVSGVAASSLGDKILSSGHYPSELRLWNSKVDYSYTSEKFVTRYTNAKVLLVGESGVGKSALAIRLVENKWDPATSSSDAVWATQLKLPNLANSDNQEREVWLWDFAGQADYRLIHQLFMDETAMALVIFNPQNADPFDALEQWDLDIGRAASRPFAKLLVAGRCDRGGLIVSKSSISEFVKTHGYSDYIETSSLMGTGCEQLSSCIISNIPWGIIPWTSSPQQFKTLKDEIVKLRDEGTVLLRLSELKQQLQLRVPNDIFDIEELDSVIALLAGPGLIWRLEFGDFVLLQPERINSYAAAVVRSVRAHPEEIGCIVEQRVLDGDLDYQDMQRLPMVEEQVVLRAMHQTFVRRGLCVREHTENGPVLIFPSYFKRERPAQECHPPLLITYRFKATPEETYATLVVKLRSTNSFKNEENWLWRFAADFKTQNGKQIGIKLRKIESGLSELSVYAETAVSDDTKVIFLRYVHEHLKQRDPELLRIRHYVCTECGTIVENINALQRRLERGLKDIICVNCEGRVIIEDLIEQLFVSNELREAVRKLDESAKETIDNESKELILIGHSFSVAGEAGQIFRPTPNSDWGIDGEIEFKNRAGDATGARVYLQLKSGQSYLKSRKSDGVEIFRISKKRHADYWCKQAYPVMLVIRTSDESIRWMNVTEYLKREERLSGKMPTQIEFKGAEFNSAEVQKMRDKLLKQRP